jgi:hypothetical protein
LGLAITALIVAYIDFSGVFDVPLYNAFVVLCPPSLLCIPYSEVMKDKSGFYFVWSFIGLVNSGLYAVIGAAVVGLWKGSRTKSV